MRMLSQILLLTLLASSTQSSIDNTNILEIGYDLLQVTQNHTNVIETSAPNIVNISGVINNTGNLTLENSESNDFPGYGVALLTIGSLGLFAASPFVYTKIQQIKTNRKIRLEQKKTENSQKEENVEEVKNKNSDKSPDTDIESYNDDDVVELSI